MALKSEFQTLQHIFRKLRLLTIAEYVDYLCMRFKHRKSNAKFRQEFPDFSVPPPHLAYDAYSAPAWYHYKSSGEESANFIKSIADKFVHNRSDSVFEWGCGPGRIIRNLPKIFNNNIQITGSDYNDESIAWCKKHIAGVTFIKNDLSPPLPVESNSFDLVYAISVFTHLSVPVSDRWTKELYRILRRGGLLVITLKGDAYLKRMLPHERDIYYSEGIVTRGEVKEGKHMYVAFHNPSFVEKSFLKKFQVLEHIANGPPLYDQDLWVVQKPTELATDTSIKPLDPR